jgi:multidrug resistance efflux pump
MTVAAQSERVSIPEAGSGSPPQPAAVEETGANPKGRRRLPAIPHFVTLAAVVLAGGLGWTAWNVYTNSAWTRDATVRADVVTMAPEVAGKIVQLPVFDNKYVRKGDLLMVIDPTNYTIAVQQGEAAIQQAKASIQNIDAQLAVQQAQIGASEAQLHQTQAALVYDQEETPRYVALAKEGAASIQLAQQYTSQLHQQQATVESAEQNVNLAQRQVETLHAQRAAAEATLAQTEAQLSQAQVNLERTRILAPVDGYVTNLLARRGDFIDVGTKTISVVDAGSFWVDGYFEETTFAGIHVGDPAEISLMGYRPIVHGHVESFARAIDVSNAQPNGQGVATVDPIYTWVRLAQRIPVRIHVDSVPPGVVLAAGMTATVQIDKREDAPKHQQPVRTGEQIAANRRV